MVRLALLVVLALTATARADKLADARQAIDEVRYDDARRLLVEAIDDGRNTTDRMRQIYELSASTAIVLDQRDLGEQYYRRWLAIDPVAKLPAGSSPKLTEAFVAAKAYMDAHGRLTATAQRATDGADVTITADPLAMAVAVIADVDPVRIVNGRAHVGIGFNAASPINAVALVDDHQNSLLVIPLPPIIVESRDIGIDPGPRVQQSQPSFFGRWTTWAVPSGACLIAGAILGGLAIDKQDQLDNKLADSGNHTFTEIQHDHDTIRRNGTIAIGLAAGATVLAIPAVVLYLRHQDPSRLGTAPIQFGPTGPTSVGVSGRF